MKPSSNRPTTHSSLTHTRVIKQIVVNRVYIYMFGHTKVKNERESFNLLLFVWYLTFFFIKNDYYHYLFFFLF